MKVKRLMASLLCGAIGAATLGLSGCGSAADSGMMDAANANAVAGGSSDLPVVTWKMGSTWGDGNIHFTCDERFSELVSQLTDGRFTITNYPEGSLCAANQLFDYVQNGTIQCGGDWGGYWAARIPLFELLSTTMDNFTGMDYYIWITQGGGLQCYQDMYGKYNMTYFPIMINHAESGIRSTRPITSIKDMQSMNIRLGGVMAGRAAKSSASTSPPLRQANCMSPSSAASSTAASSPLRARMTPSSCRRSQSTGARLHGISPAALTAS